MEEVYKNKIEQLELQLQLKQGLLEKAEAQNLSLLQKLQDAVVIIKKLKNNQHVEHVKGSVQKDKLISVNCEMALHLFKTKKRAKSFFHILFGLRNSRIDNNNEFDIDDNSVIKLDSSYYDLAKKVTKKVTKSAIGKVYHSGMVNGPIICFYSSYRAKRKANTVRTNKGESIIPWTAEEAANKNYVDSFGVQGQKYLKRFVEIKKCIDKCKDKDNKKSILNAVVGYSNMQEVMFNMPFLKNEKDSEKLFVTILNHFFLWQSVMRQIVIMMRKAKSKLEALKLILLPA